MSTNSGTASAPIGADIALAPADIRHKLAEQAYVADEALSVCVFLALRLGRPLLLEGAPGVGKTELAKALSGALRTELIRLQCYEGIELSQAAYEWDYPRQLLELQARKLVPSPEGSALDTSGLYTEAFLLRRPLLQAIAPDRTAPAVLLIDEVDRADEEFESFLLELLSEYQLSIPEFGTVRAAVRPVVLLTSNRTRELHDALKRRCLYHWLDYPDVATETEILGRRVPDLSRTLGEQVVRFVQALRGANLVKAPGVAETLDWARALRQLSGDALTLPLALATAGCLVKHQDDVQRLKGGLAAELLGRMVSSSVP